MIVAKTGEESGEKTGIRMRETDRRKQDDFLCKGTPC